MSQRTRITRRSFLEEQTTTVIGVLGQVGCFSSTMSISNAINLALAAEAAGSPKSKGEKYALLIAVTEYHHSAMNKPQLKFPEKDALALGDFLIQSQYKIDYLLGKAATRAAIIDKLAGLNLKGGGGGVALIGLFGHGVEAEFDGALESCFCPWDTTIREASESGKRLFDRDGQPMLEPIPTSLVRMQEIMKNLGLAAAKSRIVFADCCRQIPNRARNRGVGFGATFGGNLLPDESAVLFGCKSGEVSTERDDWGHGAFTKCLLEELQSLSQEGRVDTGTLGSRVKRKVLNLTGGQNPQAFQTDSIDLQLRPAVPKLLSAPFSPIEARETQQAWAAYLDVPVNHSVPLDGRLNMQFVLVPPCEFRMGSNEYPDSSETPSHRVKISKGFYLSKYVVTRSEWQAVMDTSPWKGQKWIREGNDEYPATYVSWSSAEEFCRRLSNLPAERAAGRIYRLPTEAEWESSCRSGSTTRFHFGDADDELNDYAWYDKNTELIGHDYAHPVGKKLPNPYGLYDMHGNVWEWCSDRYDPAYYAVSPTSDPQGSREGIERVTRGGGWANGPPSCRSAHRWFWLPFLMKAWIGFRVVLNLA